MGVRLSHLPPNLVAEITKYDTYNMALTIGFVQVNFPQGPRELNAHFLPYSAGVILAYALQQNPAWSVGELIWRRDPIEATANV